MLTMSNSSAQPRAPRVTPYSPGRRWRCCPRNGRPPFEFVIQGPGSSPKHKRCRLEVDVRWYALHHLDPDAMGRVGHGLESEYSHAHLKKHATLVPLPAASSDCYPALSRERMEQVMAANPALRPYLLPLVQGIQVGDRAELRVGERWWQGTVTYVADGVGVRLEDTGGADIVHELYGAPALYDEDLRRLPAAPQPLARN